MQPPARCWSAETLEDRFQALESQDKVELLLSEIKSRHALP